MVEPKVALKKVKKIRVKKQKKEILNIANAKAKSTVNININPSKRSSSKGKNNSNPRPAPVQSVSTPIYNYSTPVPNLDELISSKIQMMKNPVNDYILGQKPKSIDEILKQPKAPEAEKEQEQDETQYENEEEGTSQEKKRKREGFTRGQNTDVRDIDNIKNEIVTMGEIPVERKTYKSGSREAPSKYLERLQEQYNSILQSANLKDESVK
jgi:hypothetical protein